MAALGQEAIEPYFEEVFVGDTGNRDNLLDAKYSLRLSGKYLILPSGERFDETSSRHRAVVLEPGETAFVTTVERINMPLNWLGLIGPRYHTAEEGILFFGGMLVDPGYGSSSPGGQPLSFNIANVGAEPFELRPGLDGIASLAFFEVASVALPPHLGESSEEGVEEPARVRDELFAPGRTDPPPGIQLLQDLRRVKLDVEKVDSSVRNLVVFGTFVLVAALFGAIIAAILNISDDGDAAAKWAESPIPFGELFAWVVCPVLVAAILAVILLREFLSLSVRFRVLRRRQGRRG